MFDQYVSIFPEEKERLAVFEKQFNDNDDVVSRKNFTGHVTASAFIVNLESKRVLLLHHNVLKKYLQPGAY